VKTQLTYAHTSFKPILWLLLIAPLLLWPATGHSQIPSGISIDPSMPDSQDGVNVTINDTWNNGCVPGKPVTYKLTGKVLKITASPSSATFCTQAFSPYTITKFVGKLPAGTVTVEYYVGGTFQFRRNFTIEPAYGKLRFSSSVYGVSESFGSIMIAVVRSGGADGLVTVKYRTVGQTATPDEDYEPVSGTLRFPNGASLASFKIPIIRDDQNEGDETVKLELFDATDGAELGSPRTAVLTILDAFQPPGGGGGNEAVCATFDLFAGILRIPAFNIGDQTYWLELKLVSFEPVTFDLADYGVSDEFIEGGAYYDLFANTLRVPCFDVGTTKYWLDLKILFGPPLQFELTGYGELEE
jgi:hypothetical protein